MPLAPILPTVARVIFYKWESYHGSPFKGSSSCLALIIIICDQALIYYSQVINCDSPSAHLAPCQVGMLYYICKSLFCVYYLGKNWKAFRSKPCVGWLLIHGSVIRLEKTYYLKWMVSGYLIWESLALSYIPAYISLGLVFMKQL